MKPVFAISIGDFNGIGPEVILKACATDLPFTPLVLGHPAILNYYREKLCIAIPIESISDFSHIREGYLNVLSVKDNSETVQLQPADIDPGSVSSKAGLISMKAVETGARLCLEGKTEALITAPISKEAINAAGYHETGHTGFLARLCGCDDYAMMLINKSLRIAITSMHIPLKMAAQAVTREQILRLLGVIHRTLRFDFNIKRPKIAVLALNPHAGDGGVIGDEENEIILPAIREAGNLDIHAAGPYPADGFFGMRTFRQYDAVLAMYHDQGLIPFKTLSFGKGVNFTAGLPLIRTSPDHGTAFNIAGTGKANHLSMREAFDLAFSLHQNRVTSQSSV